MYVENALRVGDGPDVDRWLADLATRQHGVVAWFQMQAAGIPRRRVETLVALGRIHRVHRGVYAVGHQALSPSGRLMAAVLALGPTAVLSHRSAAVQWGLLRDLPAVIHVTVPGRGARRRRRGIAVHRSPDVHSEVLDGIPVTTLPRTLLDIAATAHPRTVDRAIERAEELRLFDLTAIRPLLDEARPGTRALRAAIADYDDAPTKSELERRFLELCRERGIPRPLVNVPLHGYVVDFLWPAERFIVETDGLKWHATRAALERDHERDAELALLGYRTQRFHWRLVTRKGDKVARLVLQILSERRR